MKRNPDRVDKSEQVQQEILQRLNTWSAENLGVQPSAMTFSLCENQILILMSGSQTPVEKLLSANLSSDLSFFVQASINKAIKNPIKQIIEQVLVDVEVLEIFSERCPNRTSITVILSQVPTLAQFTSDFRKSTVNTGAIASSNPPKIELIESLGSRELKVLNLIREGATNKEIAQQLDWSAHTVKNYVGSACQKLQASNRTQAVVRALQLGLLKF